VTSWQVADVTPCPRDRKSNIIPIYLRTWTSDRESRPAGFRPPRRLSVLSFLSCSVRCINTLLYCCCEPVCTVHACHLYYIIIDCINILLYIIILLHAHTCALLLLVLVLLLLIRVRDTTLPGHTEATQQLFSADRIPKISAVIYGPPRSGL